MNTISRDSTRSERGAKTGKNVVSPRDLASLYVTSSRYSFTIEWFRDRVILTQRLEYSLKVSSTPNRVVVLFCPAL